MKAEKLSGRKLKKKILELLKKKDFEESLKEICQLPAKQTVNPLFSFFYNQDELIKWRAVTSMGMVVSLLAKRDMEPARVVMRRLMWNLNDESGGIGWGSPEAMGEIMAVNKRLAEEYHHILASYICTDGNFIENEALQRGVLWGLGRLAHTEPQLVRHIAQFLLKFLESKDAALRGIAAWTAGAINTDLTRQQLIVLTKDNTKIMLYIDRQLVECSVGQLAKDALHPTFY